MFELSHDKRNITDDDLLNDLRKVACELSQKKLTQVQYKKSGKFGVTTVIRRFGGWSSATQKAGLSKTRNSNITEPELFVNLLDVWQSIGRQPSYRDIQKPLSKFHVASYERKFSSWRNALEKFVDYCNKQEEYLPVNNSKSGIRETTRTINLRLRFKILKRDNFKCVKCGVSPASNPVVKLEIDHIIPWSKGGETIEENLETLCLMCNQGKSNVL